MPRARLTTYLGTIPDYVARDIKGLKVSGVAKDGPAAKGGDIIVKLAGRKIEDIQDQTRAIEALEIGEEAAIVVQRGGDELKLKITPGSRDGQSAAAAGMQGLAAERVIDDRVNLRGSPPREW